MTSSAWGSSISCPSAFASVTWRTGRATRTACASDPWESDWTEFPVEIRRSPSEDGNKVLVAAAIRDVTDRKRAEAELIAARRAADRANQGKSRFLATAGHDLRQPLQTLSLLNGNLRRLLVEPQAAQILAQQEI